MLGDDSALQTCAVSRSGGLRAALQGLLCAGVSSSSPPSRFSCSSDGLTPGWGQLVILGCNVSYVGFRG